MFHKTEDQKGSFLEQTKAARKERALEKQRETACITIQAYVRGWLTRTKVTKTILDNFDAALQDIPEDSTKPIHIPSHQVYKQVSRLAMVWKKERDKERFVKLCRYLVCSLDSESPKVSYVGVALNKDYVLKWITQMNDILWKCCIYLKDLKLEFSSDSKQAVLFLHVLVSFTSTNTWNVLKNKNMEMLKAGMNQLCANLMGQLFQKGFYLIMKDILVHGLGQIKITLKNVSLTAIITLSLRPLIAANFSDKLMTIFLIHILSVPALIQHLGKLAPECVNNMVTHKIFTKSLELLSSQQSMRIVFNALEGNYALCLLANLLELALIEKESSLKSLGVPSFVVVITGLLESCQNYVVNKQSNLTNWHPVLGWFAQPMDPALYSSIPYVKSQLHILWNSEITKIIFGDYLSELVKDTESPQPPSPTKNTHFSGTFLKKVFENKGNRTNIQKNYRLLGSPEVQRIILICSLYHTALNTLTQLQLDILTGLCYQNTLLHDLWLFLCSLGPNCGMKTFLDHLAINTKCSAPEFQMLQLFCDCMTHYVTILDDMEMYEQQKSFKLTDFIVLSNF
ncbi:hypothetical protein HHI36_008263 [Cryptolaemus montrouzieri]|uniref:HECT-type E3 ubiquitin transferase n=1 Tax=Cryptolaemus montrouzieri TaxID=559131 RepID=A0ABD2MRY3_9CUCU